jgi:homoserine dehydrogenase
LAQYVPDGPAGQHSTGRRGPVLKVAIAGLGTVGSSVARILVEDAARVAPLRLTHILNRRIAEKRVDWIPDSVQWTESLDDVLNSDVDIFVELLGGFEPAGEWVRRALVSGRSVVTANKQLIAHHGTELLTLASRYGQHLAFGASVAGGVPVLSGLQEGLAGDQITRISGILNGTCNYILNRMESQGSTFSQALSEAQQAGFAEADPSCDVDGDDARSKIVILSRIALAAEVAPADVLCRSIRPIEAIDFHYAGVLGCTIRQISYAELRDGEIGIAVQPMLVNRNSPHAAVKGPQNLVVSTGTFGGETTFAGNGAGGGPTAVAVVSDLLALARLGGTQAEVFSSTLRSLPVTQGLVSPHYTRFLVKDRPGILRDIAGVLAAHEINIDAVLQEPGFHKDALPFVITLETCSQRQIDLALEKLSRFDFLVQPPLCLPIMKVNG